jgi:peptidoglycan hydrolase CwlO-like protein
MIFNKIYLLLSFLIVILLIVSSVWITYVPSNENFQSSAPEVKENVSRLFNLKEKKNQFLNSITKLNKEISSLKEYYSNVDKIDETN